MRFACWITKVTDIHCEYVIILIFHSNVGYANAPQYYAVRSVCASLLFISWVAEILLNLLPTTGQPNHPPGQSVRTTHVCIDTLVPPYKQVVTFSSYDEPLVSFWCQSNLSLRVNYHNATSLNEKLCVK